MLQIGKYQDNRSLGKEGKAQPARLDVDALDDVGEPLCDHEDGEHGVRRGQSRQHRCVANSDALETNDTQVLLVYDGHLVCGWRAHLGSA